MQSDSNTAETKLRNYEVDRNVYTGISDSNSDTDIVQSTPKVDKKEYMHQSEDDQQKYTQSIDRRPTGYEPVFCNFDEKPEEKYSK